MEWNTDFTHAPKDRWIEVLRSNGEIVEDHYEDYSPNDRGWIISATAWREIAPDTKTPPD